MKTLCFFSPVRYLIIIVSLNYYWWNYRLERARKMDNTMASNEQSTRARADRTFPQENSTSVSAMDQRLESECIEEYVALTLIAPSHRIDNAIITCRATYDSSQGNAIRLKDLFDISVTHRVARYSKESLYRDHNFHLRFKGIPNDAISRAIGSTHLGAIPRVRILHKREHFHNVLEHKSALACRWT